MSWNDATRRAVDARLAVAREPRFFAAREWQVLNRLCGRILPQPVDRPAVPIAALIDSKMRRMGDAGTRIEPMPWDGEAWRLALTALDGHGFMNLDDTDADALLTRMQHGALASDAWSRVPPALFFAKRLLPDIVEAYYGHPTAWSEIGFGGPASPRGYVRMDTNRRDPWEATEARDEPEAALRANRHVR